MTSATEGFYTTLVGDQTCGLPVRLALTTSEAHDNRLVLTLLSALKSGAMLLADRGFDADWIRTFVSEHGAWANIPPKRNRTEPVCFSPHLYRARNLVGRFFNKIKQCRRVATRYDKLAANYLAFIQLASIRSCLELDQEAGGAIAVILFRVDAGAHRCLEGLLRRSRWQLS